MNNKKILLKKSNVGHFYVKNIPTKKKLSEYYEKKYFKVNPRYSTKTKKFEEIYYDYQSRIRLEFILSKFKNKKKKTLLDVGAGTGRFLYYTKNFIKNSVGVDFGVDQLKYKLQKKIKLIKENPVNFLKNNTINFDIITLNNIVEHSDNVDELFDVLKKKVKKSTLILVCIPNDFSELQKHLMKNKLVKSRYWISYPDHLHYFDSKNFIKFIMKKKFKLIDAISDYPIETLLLDNNFNYTDPKLKIGKSAHYFRCKFTNFIYENSKSKDVINYFRSCFELGIGRNNLFIIKK